MLFPRPRTAFWLSLAVLLFLWAPILALFAPVAGQIFHEPRLMLRALPVNPLGRSLLISTLTLGLGSAGCALLFGLPLAIGLARGPKIWSWMARPLCALPLALPPTLLASAWLEWSRTPPARSLASLGAAQPLSFSGVFVACPLLALSYFPLVALPVMAALRAMPLELEEAARGFESGWGVWRRIIWPQIAPAVWGGAGLVFALSMWEMGAPDLLDVPTYSVQIYRDWSSQSDASRAALDGLPMFLLGALALWPALRALKFYAPSSSSSGAASSISTRAGWLGAVAGSGVLLLSPLLPIGVFMAQMGSLRTLSEAATANNEEARNTLILAALATVLMLGVSFVLVAAWRQWSRTSQGAVVMLTLFPLLCAPITLGIALIGFYNRPAFDLLNGGWRDSGNAWLNSGVGSALADIAGRYALPTLGLVARFLPLSLLLMHEAVGRIEAALPEAAQGLGASSFVVARTILWPLLKPTLAALASLLFALCAGELTVSILVQQPGATPLVLPLFNLMHIGESDLVAALCLILFALSGLPLLFGLLLSTLAAFKRHL